MGSSSLLSLRRLVDRTVRGYAVAALMSAGLTALASMVSELEPLGDERRLKRAYETVWRAAAEAAEAPASPDVERAMLALVAAQEAIALSSSEALGPREVRAIVDAAHVAEAASRAG